MAPERLNKDRHPIIAYVQDWDTRYGKFCAWLWRLIFYPVVALAIYAGNAYMNDKFVSRPDFNKAMTTFSESKDRFNEEQKTGLREISTKLDALLLRDSANAQRLSDYDRRLNRVETAVDRLNERAYSPQAAH